MAVEFPICRSVFEPFSDTTAPERKLGRRAQPSRRIAIEYVIDRMLCLGCGVDQKLAIIAKLLQPAGNVSGLIADDRV